MSPQPSRTAWPDWTPRPPICPECGRRVTLKQSHRQQWNEQTQTGRIIHAACDPLRVRVTVEAKALLLLLLLLLLLSDKGDTPVWLYITALDCGHGPKTESSHAPITASIAWCHNCGTYRGVIVHSKKLEADRD